MLWRPVSHSLTFTYWSPLPLHLALGPPTHPVFEALCESCGPVKTLELKTWPLQLCSELGLWVQPCSLFLPSGTQDLFPCHLDRSLLICILSQDSSMHLPLQPLPHLPFYHVSFFIYPKEVLPSRTIPKGTKADSKHGSSSCFSIYLLFKKFLKGWRDINFFFHRLPGNASKSHLLHREMATYVRS